MMLPKSLCDKLVIIGVIGTKIPSISGLVTKTQYESYKQGLEKRIDDIDKKIFNNSELIRNTDYNTKVTENRNKILSATGLLTTAVLNRKGKVFENKMSDSTGFITTSEFHMLIKPSFNARIIEATKGLATESQGDTTLDIADKKRKEV